VTKYCKEPPRSVVKLPAVSETMGDAAPGCSAVGGLLPVLGAVGLLRRRRARPS
jgi:hypothetical protein